MRVPRRALLLMPMLDAGARGVYAALRLIRRWRCRLLIHAIDARPSLATPPMRFIFPDVWRYAPLLSLFAISFHAAFCRHAGVPIMLLILLPPLF